MSLNDFKNHTISRRNALRAGFGIAAATQLALLESVAVSPYRASAESAAALPSIQFDIGNFIKAPATFNDGAGDVLAQFGPVFTYFVPVVLTRTPTNTDQRVLSNALNTIEQSYPFSPSGIFVFVSYSARYFDRLPGGLNGSLCQTFMPQLRSGLNPDGTTNALARSVAMPTDVVQGVVGGPGAPTKNVTKDRFNVNLVLENNDMLFQMRSDSVSNLNDVLAWLQGSNRLAGASVRSPAFNGLMSFQTTRVQFVQQGMPRQVATTNNFEFATRINPNSPMWMGFADQQVDSSGPARICTFAGNSSANLTNATASDYFGLGAVQHFSHVILDLYQFYSLPDQDSRHPEGEGADERIMYMFRANQIRTPDGLPTPFNTTDPFTNGGCPAFVNNTFQGRNDATLSARDAGGLFKSTDPAATQQTETFTGLPRIGHEAALQRSSRAADGTPIHIRMDGPGLSGMDVPQFQTFPTGGATVSAGSNQPKLQFAIFVPTSEFFRRIRTDVAAQDLQAQFKVDPEDNGLERFITTTRRQNFLVPPRSVRAFPLVEFTSTAVAPTPPADPPGAG
ncbi:DUF7405 family protein [Actinocrispum wychmicini]|uniref:Deferrochelatase/peroxidase EfeB n=1 Tax=Actinocrispum wychmicini TaxID=1213861 RepID=A0A4R2JRZ4_9PSEU|nr:hypothetical protein [Actinocrispum wychmicini]TCO62334.1 hypothetical protein EV192_102471 [Actinocrispum wychmicini]